MFTELQVQELRIAFNTWRSVEKLDGRPYPENSDDAFRIMAVRAAKYGAPEARSAFTRAFTELVAEGVIKAYKPAPQPIEVTPEFRRRVTAMSPSEVRTAYQRDPEFRKLWDALSLEQVQADGSVRLSAEGADVDANPYKNFSARDWKSTPAQTLARMMSRPEFRERVEHIAAYGDQNGERI